MKATIEKDKEHELAYISWEDEDDFGQITMSYKGNGEWLIDSEYIGMDKLLKVFKALPNI